MNIYEATHYKSDIDIENKNESRSIIYSQISNNSTVLDVGCACGDLGVILKQNKNCIVYGLEYSEKSIEVALQTKAYYDIKQCDLDYLNINDYKEYTHLFDYIVLGDILEHLKQPNEAIIKLKNFLKKDGYFIISIPNISHSSIKIELLTNKFIYSEYGILDSTHLRFFTLDSLLSMFKLLNLEIKQFNYTVVGLGCHKKQIIDKNIPIDSLKHILNDKESYCFQYICKLKQTNFFEDTDKQTLIENANNYCILKKIKKKSSICLYDYFCFINKKLKHKFKKIRGSYDQY